MNKPKGLERKEPFPVCCYANSILQAIKFSGIIIPEGLQGISNVFAKLKENAFEFYQALADQVLLYVKLFY